MGPFGFFFFSFSWERWGKSTLVQEIKTNLKLKIKGKTTSTGTLQTRWKLRQVNGWWGLEKKKKPPLPDPLRGFHTNTKIQSKFHSTGTANQRINTRPAHFLPFFFFFYPFAFWPLHTFPSEMCEKWTDGPHMGHEWGPHACTLVRFRKCTSPPTHQTLCCLCLRKEIGKREKEKREHLRAHKHMCRESLSFGVERVGVGWWRDIQLNLFSWSEVVVSLSNAPTPTTFFCLTWSFLCERRHQIQTMLWLWTGLSLSLPLSLQRRGEKRRESGKGWEENATAHLLRRPHIYKWSVLCTSPFYTFYKAESYMAATVSIHLLGHQLQQPRIPPDRRIQRIYK